MRLEDVRASDACVLPQVRVKMAALFWGGFAWVIGYIYFYAHRSMFRWPLQSGMEGSRFRWPLQSGMVGFLLFRY